MKTITMTLCRRPDYTKQVLDALRRCDGISEYTILPHVEPVSEEVIALAKGIDFAESRVTVNSSKLGVPLNTKQALEDGFSVSDFVIHVEDDTVPARDCLRFMEYCNDRFKQERKVFNVSAYSRRQVGFGDKYKVGKRLAYNCWLAGWWKNRYNWIKHKWPTNPNFGYSFYLNAYVLRASFYEAYPLLSRCQNIGRENSEHGKNNHQTNYFAGEIPPESYSE